MKFLMIITCLLLVACTSNKYFIVRHAEKAVVTRDSANMMANNPPLSEAGKVRAFVLRDELRGEKISHIFSTNTIRTTSTAKPLSESTGITIQLYNSSRDSINAFIEKVKSLNGNVLIVGHSNTVDDLANALTGRKVIPGDLADNEYDNLFVILKRGKKMIFEKKKFGYPSTPE